MQVGISCSMSSNQGPESIRVKVSLLLTFFLHGNEMEMVPGMNDFASNVRLVV